MLTGAGTNEYALIYQNHLLSIRQIVARAYYFIKQYLKAHLLLVQKTGVENKNTITCKEK
jgi:hypothetical protein